MKNRLLLATSAISIEALLEYRGFPIMQKPKIEHCAALPYEISDPRKKPKPRYLY